MPPDDVGTRAHLPVLLEPALAGLDPRPDGTYIDGTFGRGGHAMAILERLGPDGRLLAIDRDPEAIAFAEERLGGDARVVIRRGSFAELARVAKEEGIHGEVDGLLLDLGVSSPQLDDAGRGFSFSRGGPLDMRMDPDSGESAAEWLMRVEEEELARVLREYGEERFARRIARAVVRARNETPLTDTAQLAEIIAGAVPTREPGKHPATRSFQAIRIYINGELEALDRVLDDSAGLLKLGGRLCVISFHSLEDRRVKRFIRGNRDAPRVVGGVPLPDPEPAPFRAVGRAVQADETETARNPRARSAVLRVAERQG
jgi:16S rRNA (cytosine1402-N4)-methyltransferase